MSDLVARLRQVQSARQQGFYTIHEPDALANEAADLIASQAAQITALQAQLAKALVGLTDLEGWIKDQGFPEDGRMLMTCREHIAAIRAIRAMKGEA